MDLYAEIILDHFKNPQNHGLIEGAQIVGEDLNPLCGDKVKTSLLVNSDGVIVKFGFTADGCAISVASTSILGEKLVGMKIGDLVNMSNEEVLENLGVPISMGRVKCALLGFTCLKKSIKIFEAEQSIKN